MDVEALRQLKALKDEGVITEEEFIAKKSELLGASSASPQPRAAAPEASTPSTSASATVPVGQNLNVALINSRVGYVALAFLFGMFLPSVQTSSRSETGWGLATSGERPLVSLLLLVPIASVWVLYCLASGRAIHKAVRLAGLAPFVLLPLVKWSKIGFGGWWMMLAGIPFLLLVKPSPLVTATAPDSTRVTRTTADQVRMTDQGHRAALLAAVVAAIAVFLPWVEGSGSSSYGEFSASYSTGGISGFSLGGGLIGLLLAVAGGYMVAKRIKWAFVAGAVNVLDGLGCMLGWFGAGGEASFSASFGGASARASVDPQIGLYLFVLASLVFCILTFKDLKVAEQR